MVLPWSTCVFYACCMLDGVKVAHCVAAGGRREPRWLNGIKNARVSPGIACGRCVARAPRSRRCADPPASMQPCGEAHCCGVASPDEQRAGRFATPAPSPRRRASLFLQSCRVALSVLHDSLVAAALQGNDEHCHRGPNVSRQSARTAVLALLDRSVYRIKEPRQQPNEDRQRGPRRQPPIPRVKRTQVNDSCLLQS